MDRSIIIVLAIILFILIILNNISKNKDDTTEESEERVASCSQTTFGCCPNGVDSKINYYGTNCPGYRPGPGYQPVVTPRIPPKPVVRPYVPPNPVGGCSGTRYGCCPNNITPKYNEQGSNCPGYKPVITPIGGCSTTRYGCCPDNITPKYDEEGSNCI